MAHSSELRWKEAAASVAQKSRATLQALREAEDIYQDLLEVYNYTGGTDQVFADVLFQDENGNPDPIADSATAEQVARVTDLRTAITALHELFQSGNNIVVSQEDRFAQLRRMS